MTQRARNISVNTWLRTPARRVTVVEVELPIPRPLGNNLGPRRTTTVAHGICSGSLLDTIWFGPVLLTTLSQLITNYKLLQAVRPYLSNYKGLFFRHCHYTYTEVRLVTT